MHESLKLRSQRDMDQIFSVNATDPEMQQAIQEARDRFSEFLKVADADIERIIPCLDDVLIKIYLSNPDSPDSGEHVWVRYLGRDERDKTRFRGELISSPNKVKVLKKGQVANFKLERVSDWLYVEDDKAHGAFTVQLLRRRMTPKERKKHDAGYPFKFD